MDDNFLVAATNYTLHNSIMKLKSQGEGHVFADICVKKLMSLKSTDKDLLYNGEEIVTECFLELCRIEEVMYHGTLLQLDNYCNGY